MTLETRNKSQELTGFIDTVHTTIKGILLLRYFHFFTEFRRVFPSQLLKNWLHGKCCSLHRGFTYILFLMVPLNCLLSYLVLAEVAMSLNETLGLDLPLSNATSQSLQDDISAFLDALRKKDFVQQHHNATSVLK